MTGAVAQNRFAPPRAEVEDQADDAGVMLDASRGARLLAVLIDSVLPLVLIGLILAAVAIPAYENYRQAHVPGIAPPRSSPHHITTAWAWLGGVAVLGFYVWSTVLVYLYGQTFGKRVMDIRVVRTDGSRVSFARFIFVRWLPLFVGALRAGGQLRHHAARPAADLPRIAPLPARRHRRHQGRHRRVVGRRHAATAMRSTPAPRLRTITF